MYSKISILILFFALPSFCFAQKDITPPEPPKIDYISVNPETNAIDVFWFKSPSKDVAKYKIYRFERDIYFMPIDSTPNADSLHYKITRLVQPALQSESIAVAAQDSAYNGSKGLMLHKTVHLTAIFDSCINSINLSWNAYEGWIPVAYDIMVSSNHSTYSLLQRVSSTTLTYELKSLDDTTEYCYYIIAVRSDNIKSYSNKKCIRTNSLFTRVNIQPSEIRPDTAGKNWLFTFDAAPPDKSYSFVLAKSDSPQGSFDSIASTASASQLNFSDLLNSDIHYYQVEGRFAQCTLAAVTSGIVSPMLLKVEKKDDRYSASWNYFPVSGHPSAEFNFYIEKPGETATFLAKLNEPNFDVAYNALGDYENTEHICFFVSATLSSANSDFSLLSQKVCLLLETEIMMSEAFTPNGDGIHDEITPKFNRMPREYVFTITDRWGKIVFETKAQGQGWNGTVNSGKAIEGMYIYQVQGTGFNGKKFDKSGYFSLIYP